MLKYFNYMRFILLFLGPFLLVDAFAQISTDPPFPRSDEPVTISINVSGTDLEDSNDPVWLWAWIIENCSSGCDAPTNVTPATEAQDDALMTKSESDPNIYTITITPTDFFGKPADEIKKIGVLAKGRDWGNGQTGDMTIEMSEGQFEVIFTQPSAQPVFLDIDESVEIIATASESALLKLFVNDVEVATEADATEVTYTYIAAESGRVNIKVTGDNGSATAEAFTYLVITSPTINEPRPEGIIAGINYVEDPTKVVLDLWAPEKSTVYVLGEFNEWQVHPDYQMKNDGEHFWLEISGLTAGKEYAFQYLVDESIYIADPFSDKILDPDDQYIPEGVYPNLKSYPQEALHTEWYFNRVSIIQTNQAPYDWQHEPVALAVDSLIIYELLIRDFFENGERTYLNLIDTLSYLKELGVNAIELMPVMEFSGNDSWGYNPTFKFAADKYYGSKNDLKAFIDAAHGMDMAVILDIVMNHHEIPNPLVMMYFDFSQFKPLASNPWFNVDATHPFSVFFDFDHESLYTQQYLDTVNYYWLTEYKVDGFRYDLSKGFTQKNSGGNVGAWSAYDASRIALLKRMKAEVDAYAPDALLILEHFADNAEEKELAQEGFLLWGNVHHSSGQLAMGYASDSDISWGYYENRGWSSPNLITYMESHDEERLSYKVEQYGNSSGSYSTKTAEERIERLKGVALLNYLVPGPKMFWQWGEWGYDISIEENGRTGIKPIPWNNIDGLNYNNTAANIELYQFYKTILNLRRDQPVFSFGKAELSSPGALLRQVTITPSGQEEQLSSVILGNFDVTQKTVTATFPETGAWYDYFDNSGNLNLESATTSITLQPGEFRLFTNEELADPEFVTGINEKDIKTILYPNPASEQLNFFLEYPSSIRIIDQKGVILSEHTLPVGEVSVPVAALGKGIYLLEIRSAQARSVVKFIKN